MIVVPLSGWVAAIKPQMEKFREATEAQFQEFVAKHARDYEEAVSAQPKVGTSRRQADTK